MSDISDSDWSTFQDKLFTTAQERYCRKALVEIQRTMTLPNESYRDRLVKVETLLDDRHKVMEQIFAEPNKSKAYFQMAALRARGLVTEAEFKQLSAEARTKVDGLMAMMQKR